MAIKIFIKTNDDSSFLFKNEANPGFVAKPKTYELELVPTQIRKHKADETKEYTVRCINLYTKNVLFEAVKVSEIDVNGTVYPDYATLSAALAGLVFKKGGGIGQGDVQLSFDIPNQKLILLDRNSVVLTEVSVAFLNDEAKYLDYDGSNLILKNEQWEILSTLPISLFIGSVGTQLQLNSNQLQLKDSQGNILSSVTFEVSNINGPQSSFDESILIDSSGNIEGNVSLFTEYFNTQYCILAFTPIQILGVYKNGLKLLQSEYTITLPKTISINTYVDENIEIQYTHLKNILT